MSFPRKSHMEGQGSLESFLFWVDSNFGENTYLWEPYQERLFYGE